MSKRRTQTYPGTYQQPDGSWRYSFDAPPKPDGKRNQRQKKGFPDQEAAWDAMLEAKRELRIGGYAEVSDETLDEYFHRWMRDTQAGRRPPTNRAYRNAWLRYPDGFRKTKLVKVTPSAVRAVFADIVTRYAPSTARETRSILATVCGAALQERLIPFDPTDGIKMAISRDADEASHFDPANVWTRDEAKAFLAATADNPNHVLWRFLLDSGLRISEALALTWDDLDLEARLVRVRRTITSDADGRAIVGTQPKTAKSRRDVTLMAETVAHLERYRTQQKARRLRCGPLWLDAGVVFDAGDGAYLSREASAKRFERVVVSLPVRRLTLHGLRHTMAVTWLQAGRSPAVVADRLGHASAAFTLAVYAKVTTDWQRRDTDAVEAFLRDENPADVAPMLAFPEKGTQPRG